MRDDDLRLRAAALPDEIFRHVAIQADDGAGEGELVEEVAADRRVLGTAAGRKRAGLGPGRDLADGAAAHAAGAELEVTVETVVEFAPLPAGDEFLQALLGPGRQAAREPGVQVVGGDRHQLAGLHGREDLVGRGHGNGTIVRFSSFIVQLSFSGFLRSGR
jgi:hypothetical protein